MIGYPIDQSKGLTVFLNDPYRQVLGVKGQTKKLVTVIDNAEFGGYSTFTVLPYDKIKGFNKDVIAKIKYHKRLMKRANKERNISRYVRLASDLAKVYEQAIASHPKIRTQQNG